MLCLRPLRLPAVLVGDGRLGGISSTISAYESLRLRGYDVVAVLVEDHGLLNEASLQSYLRSRLVILIYVFLPLKFVDSFHNSNYSCLF